MAVQGQVYSINDVLPPGQATRHRIVVLTNSNLLATMGSGRNFILCAIIRSAVHQDGRPVRKRFGHSVVLPANEIKGLPNESIIETHQLFHYPLTRIGPQTLAGQLSKDRLAEVLEGAKRVLS